MATRNIKNMPVMAGRCQTCPFGEPGGLDRCQRTADMVRARCLTTASQICHHPRVHGKKETHLCRGARDFQLQVFHALGFPQEPTDEAWQLKLDSINKINIEG